MALSNAEKSRRYRERNPDKFRESLKKYWNKKYTCECGKILTQKNRASHKRTKQHIMFIDFMDMKQKLKQYEEGKTEESETETDSEEEEFINDYLSKGKYDKDGLLITTDSETD